MKKFLLWIWQLPQNLIGLLLTIGTYEYCVDGIKCHMKNDFFRSGISLGNYIILDHIHMRIGRELLKRSARHEHGHQLQSLYLGPLYLIVIGLPSFIGNIISRIFHKDAKWYYNQPWEKWADKLGKVER